MNRLGNSFALKYRTEINWNKFFFFFFNGHMLEIKNAQIINVRHFVSRMKRLGYLSKRNDFRLKLANEYWWYLLHGICWHTAVRWRFVKCSYREISHGLSHSFSFFFFLRRPIILMQMLPNEATPIKYNLRPSCTTHTEALIYSTRVLFWNALWGDGMETPHVQSRFFGLIRFRDD